MARGASKTAGRTAKRPSLTISPERYLFPHGIQVFGHGWGNCPVLLLLDGKREVRPKRVLVGEQRGDAVAPVNGDFEVVLSIPGLTRRRHTIRAVERTKGTSATAEADFVLLDLADYEADGRPTQRWFRRQEHFFKRRFGDAGPPHIAPRLLALEHRDRMRARDALARARRATALDPDAPSVPVIPGANWYGIGP